MKKIDQLKGQALQILDKESELKTYQVAGLCSPPTSTSAMGMALKQLQAEGVVKVFNFRWSMVSEVSDAA